MNFYIFGLQRSGTNLVQTIMETNFGGVVKNQGEKQWKHCLSPDENLNFADPILKVIKSPYTWVESIVFRDRADFYEKHDGNFFDPAPVMVDDVNLMNLVYVYKSHYNKWKETGTLIRYEDILYPDQQREYFSDILLSEVNKSEWVSPEPGSMFMCEDFKDEHRDYYEKQRPSKLSGMHILTINRLLTKDFFRETGYKMLRYRGTGPSSF